MVISVAMPLMLLLLFGFAISTEVSHVRTAIAVESFSPRVRDIVARLEANPTFDFVGLIAPSDAEPLLRSGECDAVLIMSQSGAQVIVDASNTNTARTVTTYLEQLAGSRDEVSPIVMSVLYNPQLKSAYNFVPGILGMIFILICAIITSVSIVREKETGTMNLLLISPVKPGTVILGKLVPYFVLCMVILVLMLTVSYTLLGLPMGATVWSVVGLSTLYVVLSLSIGLLVSTLVDTQLNALIVSAVLFMLPVLLLSGMIYPVDNMPRPLQWFSAIIPARWYIEAMRKLMVQQLPMSMALKETAILLSMTGLILTAAIKKFKSQ